MKKWLVYVVTMIYSLVHTAVNLPMSFPAGAGLPPMTGAPMTGAPEPGSFDEFFLNAIAGMSDRELEELARMGAQIAEDLESQGIDVDAFLREQLAEFPAQAPEFKPKAEQDAQQKKEIEVELPQPELEEKAPVEVRPLVPITSDKKEQIDYALMIIGEKIPELLRQTRNDLTYQEEITPFVDDLITVNYYVRLLRQEKYTKYIGQETFSSLYEDLKRLSNVLEHQEPLLFVTENQEEIDDAFSRLRVPKSASMNDIEKAYKKRMRTANPARVQSDLEDAGASREKIALEVERAQKEFAKVETAYYTTQRIAKSHAAFNAILSTIASTLTPIIDETQKLLKAYDPEALKIKEAHEKRVAEAQSLAREAGKKEAPQAPYVFDRAAFGYPSVTPRDEAYYPPASMMQPSTTPSSQEGPGFAGSGAPSKPGAPEKKGEEKKETKKPETPEEKKASEKEKKEKEAIEKKKVDKKNQEFQMKFKLAQRKEAFDRLIDYLDEVPPTQSESRFKLFDDFQKYITIDSITYPYTSPVVETELSKAQEVSQTLSYMIQSLQILKNDITRDISSLPKELKEKYIKELQEMFKKYQDDQFKKKLSKLLDLKVDHLKKEVVAGTNKLKLQSNEKNYIFLGFDNFAPSGGQPGKSVLFDNDHAVIRNMNLSSSAQGPVNLVAGITELYKQLTDLITKK